MAFTVTNGKIAQIDVLLDPNVWSSSTSPSRRRRANTADPQASFPRFAGKTVNAEKHVVRQKQGALASQS